MSIIDRNPVPLLDRQTVRNPYNLLEFATLLETLGPVQGSTCSTPVAAKDDSRASSPAPAQKA